MNKKIVTIIVTFNGENFIKDCLDSVRNSDLPSEIVIIDNASTDNTISIIKQEDYEVTLIKNERNIGFGLANNIGLRYALKKSFNYILLLNQDAVVEINMLTILIQAFEQYPEYGILSPLHLQSNKRFLDNNFYRYLTQGCPEYITDLSLKRNIKLAYSSSFVNAAIWLLSRHCVEKVGGFDPIFFYRGEDNDYFNRVIYKGFRMGISPNAIAYHHRENRREKESDIFYNRYISSLVWLKDPRINNSAGLLLYNILLNSFQDLFCLEFKSFKENWIVFFKILLRMKQIKTSRRICKGDSYRVYL